MDFIDYSVQLRVSTELGPSRAMVLADVLKARFEGIEIEFEPTDYERDLGWAVFGPDGDRKDAIVSWLMAFREQYD